MRLVAIDPGLNLSGVAIFEDSKLVHSGVVKVAKRDLPLTTRVVSMGAGLTFEARRRGEPDLVLLEWPQVYDGRIGGKTKGQDPNDLLPLAGIDAIVAAAFQNVEIVTPSDWKQQIPKPKKRSDPYIVAARAKARLSESVSELAAIAQVRDNEWDRWDSIGLGLWRLGRFADRVFPGATLH